jgi:hypothetical protein
VLGYIMHWGLNRSQTGPLDQGESHGPVRHLSLYVKSDLYERVQKAATAAGVKTAPWLRHMVHQVTIADFPGSWQEAQSEERSHDSRTYGTRFMLRLDNLTRETLEGRSTHFDKPAAEIIRQLIAQATHEDFPTSWQGMTKGHRTPHARQ